jgi:protein-S-isoprenylcysteine O-methyltransferase Ste14
MYLAFIVALYIEMYGFPLTMYIVSWLLGFSNPGNLWYLFVGVVGKDAFVSILYTVMLPASNTLIFVGVLLVFFGWKRIYHNKNGLVTTGIYSHVRHPQYLGLLLITLGINVLWVTLSTLLLYPVLVFLYYRLARTEDKQMQTQFGDQFLEYKQNVPMFIPRLRTT